jgi:hypothetical protein
MPEIRVIEPIIFAPAEKLRVCAYARVSSDSTDQRNSFASQVNYYTKYIQAHEGWTFVDIYIPLKKHSENSSANWTNVFTEWVVPLSSTFPASIKSLKLMFFYLTGRSFPCPEGNMNL